MPAFFASFRLKIRSNLTRHLNLGRALAVQAIELKANQLSEAEKAAGWQLLFDGQSTAQWRAFQKEKFPEVGWAVDKEGNLFKLLLL